MKRDDAMAKGADEATREFEAAARRVARLFRSRGARATREASARVRCEKAVGGRAKAALDFFTSYWVDLARPALVSLACEAVGGDPADAPFLGKSLSLLSGATDIHDDIIDRTVTKTKRKTVNGKFGDEVALLAGDVLYFEGFAELFGGLAKLKAPLERKAAIVAAVRELYLEMCDGEAEELEFRGRTDVDPDDYLAVIRKKAADVEACLRAGAILGGGTPRQVAALADYGRALGMMVLLRNDFEDMCDFVLLRSRLKYESLPLPLLFALEDKEKKEEIIRILGDLDREGAKRLLRLVAEAGAVVRLERLLVSLKQQADSRIYDHGWTDFKTILTATFPGKLR